MPLSELSDPSILLQQNWDAHANKYSDGTVGFDPEYVAGVGPRVWLVDTRDDEGLRGPQGHIPGIARMPLARLAELRELLPTDTPVILVCDIGRESAMGARYLLGLGMHRVGYMRGGMKAWRSAGFGVSRDEQALERWVGRAEPGIGADGNPLRPTKAVGAGLSLEEIEEHVGDPSKIRRVKLAAFLLATHTSCVDGREDQAIIGTPGGDSGELLLALAALESILGQALSEQEVAALARRFADAVGGIYLHTDNHALNSLARALRDDERLSARVKGNTSIEDWESYLRRPPEEDREFVLEHLEEPAHIGCGHIRLSIMNPEAYQIRPELIRAFFRTFYRDLWKGAEDLGWVVLGGDHKEGAVVNVRLADEPHPFSEIPMFVPSIAGTQLFVNHPQVVAYLRQQYSALLAELASEVLVHPEVHGEDLSRSIEELAGTQLEATLAALAEGLPTFEVLFDGAEVNVKAGPRIPSTG